MKRLISLAVAGAGLALAAAPAASADTVTLKSSSSSQYGKHVTDADGRALYLFEKDRQGKGMVTPQSNCYDACAKAWPPLIADGDPKAGDGIDKTRVGRLARRDGQQQVTYNGWPLYYFTKDAKPGQTTGQDVKGFGAEWYLIGPDGNKVEAEKKKP